MSREHPYLPPACMQRRSAASAIAQHLVFRLRYGACNQSCGVSLLWKLHSSSSVLIVMEFKLWRDAVTRSRWFRVALDVAVIVLLNIINAVIRVRQATGLVVYRGFFCEDRSIRLPDREEIVPTWALLLGALGIPLATVRRWFITVGLSCRATRPIKKTNNYFRKWNFNSPLPLEETKNHQAKFLFPFSEKLSPMLETHGSLFQKNIK